MPAQVTKSALAAKLGQRGAKAVQEHRGDATTYGIQRLPGGISNGVARLVECKFDTVKEGKQNAGEFFFRAAGVVLEPATNDKGVPVRGLQTSIMEMVCDTTTRDGKKTTLEEHIANILNEMRKLGADVEDAGVNDLERIAAELLELKPVFRFSTTTLPPQIDPKTKQPKLNPQTGLPYEPRTFENWHGTRGLEDYEAPEGGGVVDETGDSTGTVTVSVSANGAVAEHEESAPAATDEFGDIDSLAAKADAGDDDAAAELQRQAVDLGIDEAALAKAPNWAAVAALMASHDGEEPGEVAVGNVYKLVLRDAKGKPLADPKNPKKPMKPVEVEVESFDAKAGTARVKNLTNPKLKYTVRQDELLPPE